MRLDRPAQGTISVSTRQVGEWAEMKLRDNGCTMPPAVRERIFDPFFPTRSVGRGMEQGIAIAHDAIVNQHGSTTGVEREPGVGLTFTIRLPIEQRGSAPIAAG